MRRLHPGSHLTAHLFPYPTLFRSEGARDHDQHGACRVRDGEPPLRACRLPGPRRLREEHDHGGGADGWRDPGGVGGGRADAADRSEEHTSELQSLMRISSAVFCLKKKKNKNGEIDEITDPTE